MKKQVFNYILSGSVMLLCFSCTKTSFKEGNYFYSFDDLSPYVKNNNTLVKEAAKSGHYCLRVDSTSVFGLTFRQKIGDISSKSVTKVKLSAWVKCKNIDFFTGKLVCSVESPEGKGLSWEGYDLLNTVSNPDKWTEVTTEFDISKYNNVNNVLVIYPINSGGSDYLFDDLSISIE
jgi:hypothetical protein